MARDLVELHARIDYCRAEIDAIHQDADRFSRENVTCETDPSYWLQYATLLAEPPLALRARTGTTINELRAVLDGLATALAVRNGATSTHDTYFPASKSAKIFSDVGMRQIRRLGASDQQTIIDLEPFRGGHPQLFALHEADRVRKHTRLLAGAGAGGWIPIDGSPHVLGQPAKYDLMGLLTEVGQRRLIGEFRHETVGTQFRLHVGMVFFEPMEIKGHSLGPQLSVFADITSDIVSLFD